MASGAPVIAADTGAYAAMIDPGTNGYIFPVHDTDKFKEYLQRLMSDPEALLSISDDCQRRVQEKFSIEKEVQGIADVYRRLWDTKS